MKPAHPRATRALPALPPCRPPHLPAWERTVHSMGLVSATLLYIHRLETGVASSNVEIARLRRRLEFAEILADAYMERIINPKAADWLKKIWGSAPDFPM